MGWRAPFGSLRLVRSERPMNYRIVALISLFSVIACAHPTSISGPAPPSAPQVVEVRIVSLPPVSACTQIIHEPSTIASIVESNAFATKWWKTDGHPYREDDLLPLYRVEFALREGEAATYWLGANSYPGRFPCYSFCSGWWAAPSSADGSIDLGRVKGLAETTYFRLHHDLNIPCRLLTPV